ncbi:MAG: nucleotidyl transferase AbiEii/AbiGii toxin family protein [Oligoflexia bacterium]|nr:nucleotidyl transferase AbiEii/AbiGii toxin family protein [Oligoflexia bacterium]
MIPRSDILKWSEHAPWSLEHQVEQDLVLTRVLVELFSHPVLREQLAFRGGTALNKLFFNQPTRYSEDIDLVQITGEKIGETFDIIREILSPWLGNPKSKQNFGRATQIYRFDSEIEPIVNLKLKIEINTREHFSVFGLLEKELVLNTKWYSGKAKIKTYTLEELLGTKLRALYQRKKGRDIYDLSVALTQLKPDKEKIVTSFLEYIKFSGNKITRAEFEENLYLKLLDPLFINDINPLLKINTQEIGVDMEFYSKHIYSDLLSLIPGEPWKSKKNNESKKIYDE